MLFNFTIVYTVDGASYKASGTSLQNDAVSAAQNIEAAYQKITRGVFEARAIELHAANTNDEGTYASAHSL